MKIINIVPGSGGTFYCQNCLRDSELIRTLRALGNEVTLVPLYLPLSADAPEIARDTPVFFGAINIYLKQVMPLYRKAPQWLERLLNSPTMLKWAAKKSGSTNAPGLEELTLSTLRGENGYQASELDHLISWLKQVEKPHVIHLSNALLLGLAHRLKNEVKVPLVCSLEDENVWIDPMSQGYRRQIWQLMAEQAKDVDAFVAASHYYADFMKKQLGLADDKLFVVHTGINHDGYEPAPLIFSPPTIGYLCRLAEFFGLRILVDAFIILKNERSFSNLKLRLTGGFTAADSKFIKSIVKKLKKEKVLKDVDFVKDFSPAKRKEFLKSLSVLSVPVVKGEALGSYLIEALAAGVPVVQPLLGGYPELINLTQGGILFTPNDSHHLAKALASLLTDPAQARNLAAKGREAIFEKFSMQKMADQMMQIYRTVLVR